MTELLTLEDLPSGFSYPSEFIRIVELGLTNLEPWWIAGGEPLRARHRGLRDRYPTRILVPFASRQDCDDVACWNCANPPQVIVIHDFASVGFEVESTFVDFTAWFRKAIDDMLDWD